MHQPGSHWGETVNTYSLTFSPHVSEPPPSPFYIFPWAQFKTDLYETRYPLVSANPKTVTLLHNFQTRLLPNWVEKVEGWQIWVKNNMCNKLIKGNNKLTDIFHSFKLHTTWFVINLKYICHSPPPTYFGYFIL